MSKNNNNNNNYYYYHKNNNSNNEGKVSFSDYCRCVAQIKNQVSHDHRSYGRNLSNCVEKFEKGFSTQLLD